MVRQGGPCSSKLQLCSYAIGGQGRAQAWQGKQDHGVVRWGKLKLDLAGHIGQIRPGPGGASLPG